WPSATAGSSAPKAGARAAAHTLIATVATIAHGPPHPLLRFIVPPLLAPGVLPPGLADGDSCSHTCRAEALSNCMARIAFTSRGKEATSEGIGGGMRAPIVVALVLSLAAALAVGEDLPTVLKGASAAARPTAALRADGTLVTASPDGTVRDQIAIVRRPNGDLYVELREAGTRALLFADGDKALLVPAKGKRSEPFALDASLGGSEFTREDLRPFNVQNYQSPTIVDRRNGEVTVSLTPNAGSQYSLQVITFDSERKVPLIVKNY